MPLRQLVPDPAVGSSTSDVKVDIIAVHGLNPRSKDAAAHAWDTWRTPPGPKGHLWLRENLPSVVPHSRIFLYQYNATAVYGKDQSTFVDKADELLEAIRVKRVKVESRPIIFLCHSMGGLLVKQALINAHSNPKYTSIKTATSGLVFFATPHNGGDWKLVTLGTLASKIATTAGFQKGDDVVEVLKSGSMFSAIMNEHWRHQLLEYDIVSFWGALDTIVPKESARLGMPGDRENVVKLNADHRGVCKFGSSETDQDNLELVCANIENLFQSALKREHATKGMETWHGDVHQTLQDFISVQKDTYRDKTESACRRDLRVVDPQHDMERIEKSKDELLDDVYKWILRTQEYAAFTNWDSSGSNCPPRRLLWIKGHAGTGKTMLMIGLIRQLLQQPVTASPKLSFFFCQGTNEALNNATAVLRSLIWLLLLQQPYLISHLLQKYKESGADLFKDQNAFFALSEVFQNMLKDPLLSFIYLAIDALDECAEWRSKLIDLISTSLTLSQNVKWLISSRPEVDLLAALKDSGTNSLIELDTQNLAEPVNIYIDHKLTILKRSIGYNDSVLAEVSREVRKRAENTFLWVALVFKELEEVHGGYAVKLIKEMPPGLSELYNHMITRIEKVRKIKPQDCKTVLVVMSLAFRPLAISELSVLSDLPLDMAETAVKMCGSFLTVANKTVNLIHQSAKDYLEENFKLRLQAAGPAQGHSEIIKRSTNAMSSMLRRNMYNLDFGFKPENMMPPDPDPLAPIRYSCLFWADHLCSLNSDNFLGELTDDGRVFRFLKEYFLRWFESLSLIGQISSGLLSIRKILRAAQSQPDINSRLTELLKDAEKFVFSHRSIIEQAPLQIYGSALVFSPILSDIRKRYWKERLSFIEMATGIRDRWGAHRQTLEGHGDSVNAVAFSPDGNTLASASDDNTIRLWDTATGAHRQTLKGHGGSVNAVAFSPDGNTLASASDDCTIRLWDMATGAHRQTLEGHRGPVYAVAFSPDGNTLASASYDRTIRLWDTATGAHRQTLEGHDDSVNAVAFSPDGNTLASASSDYTIRLWNTATGAHRQTLEGHGSSVKALAFSPDGNTLASASDDRTIRLWDTATGAHRQTLEGHRGWVNAVAFSPDGNTLASASSDYTIRLWNTATGAHRQTLDGDGSWVNAVAFSPDGNTLASASYDRTIRLWNTATGAHRQTLEGHRSFIKAVAFSPDGNTLASASDDRTIRLWDTATGAHRQTLEGHDDSVNAVAFSPDGNTLASASYDRTIRLWNTATGAHRQTLEGHGGPVRAVAFSRNGQCLETDRGLLSITVNSDASSSSGDQKLASSFLFVGDDWVTRNGKSVLWLPVDYRATYVAVHGQTLILGNSFGQVMFFRFSFTE